jgi:hypothetical protein
MPPPEPTEPHRPLQTSTRPRVLASASRRSLPVSPAPADVRDLGAPEKPLEPSWPPAPWPQSATDETRDLPVGEPQGSRGEAHDQSLAVPRVAAPSAATYGTVAAPRSTTRLSAHASSALLEESRCLASVRAALHAGDPNRALDLLTLMPSTPALAQERESLTIEAMAEKPGLRAAAAERARVFLEAYPDSPYRARIRSVTLDRK